MGHDVTEKGQTNQINSLCLENQMYFSIIIYHILCVHSFESSGEKQKEKKK